jgi:hypothetical protein
MRFPYQLAFVRAAFFLLYFTTTASPRMVFGLILVGVESLRPFPNHEFGFLLGRHPASTAKLAWYCWAVS